MDSLFFQFKLALRQGWNGILEWVVDNPMIFLFLAAVIFIMWRLMSPTVRNKL
jgi:hypothetical protein